MRCRWRSHRPGGEARVVSAEGEPVGAVSLGALVRALGNDREADRAAVGAAGPGA